MSKTRKIKKPKQQKPQAELSEEQLNNVSGGIIAVRPATSSRADEGPKESITFLFAKVAIEY